LFGFRGKCLAYKVSQRDAQPIGGFEVLLFIKVRRIRLSFVSGTPLTITLENNMLPTGSYSKRRTPNISCNKLRCKKASNICHFSAGFFQSIKKVGVIKINKLAIFTGKT
jgi:hypothetical protein